MSTAPSPSHLDSLQGGMMWDAASCETWAVRFPRPPRNSRKGRLPFLLLLPKIVFPPASHLLTIRQDQSHPSTSAWTLSPSTTGHILLQRQSRSKISGSCGAPTSRLTMADDSGIYHGPFRTKNITGSCDGLHHRPSPSRHMTISSCSDAGSRNRDDVQLTSNLRFPSSNKR